MAIEWAPAGPGIEQAVARTAVEFLDALRRSNNDWWEGERMPWAFRGQASEKWPLLPSAWRVGNLSIASAKEEGARRFERGNHSPELRWQEANHVFGKASFGERDRELARALVIDSSAELMLVWDFIHTANEHGLPVPGADLPPDVIVDEEWLQTPAVPLVGDDFLRWSGLSEQLALAQHHGIPTRFIDWTLIRSQPLSLRARGSKPRQTRIRSRSSLSTAEGHER